MNKPLKFWILSLIIILAAIIVSVVILFWFYQKNLLTAPAQPVVIDKNAVKNFCTQEAKLCPDGTYVSRHLPDCEFAVCPEVVGLADKILISAPAKNSTITSPVVVTGRARGTWFFEGSFPVEIYDANDKLLGQKYASFMPSPQEPEWMTENFINFSGSIEFSQSTTETGYILFKKDNPSDMRELDESFKLPIKFTIKTQESSSSTVECKNYKNTDLGFSLTCPAGWVAVRQDNQSGSTDGDGRRVSFWNRKDYMDFIPEASEGLSDKVYSFSVIYDDKERSELIKDPYVKILSSAPIKIDGAVGTRDVFEGPYGQWTAIYLNKNGIVYLLTVPNDNAEQKKAADQILASFKFIN